MPFHKHWFRFKIHHIVAYHKKNVQDYLIRSCSFISRKILLIDEDIEFNLT